MFAATLTSLYYLPFLARQPWLECDTKLTMRVGTDNTKLFGLSLLPTSDRIDGRVRSPQFQTSSTMIGGLDDSDGYCRW